MMHFDFDEDAGIDLTPVIDVIFMLLIFFIMTTTFSKPVMEVILPVSETAAPNESRQQELLITVTAEGVVYHGKTVLDDAALGGLLDKHDDHLLNLFVDEKAPFEAFVAVVDVVRVKRGDKFVISTQPRAEETGGGKDTLISEQKRPLLNP